MTGFARRRSAQPSAPEAARDDDVSPTSPTSPSSPGPQDGVRYGAKLLSKLAYLANGLAANDFKPTDQQVEVQRILSGAAVLETVDWPGKFIPLVPVYGEEIRVDGRRRLRGCPQALP